MINYFLASFFLASAKDHHLFEVFSESVNITFKMRFFNFFKQQNLDWKTDIYLNFYRLLCSLVSCFQNCGNILGYIRKIISQFLKILNFLFSCSHLEEKTQWEHPKSGKRKRVAGGLC